MKNQINPDCVFCKISKHEIPSHIVYENEYVMAFLDLYPNSNGHTLIIPKVHFDNYSDCDDRYLAAVALAKKVIAKKILTELKPAGINYTSNQGEEAYQAVFHYHEHVIPKYIKNEGYVICNKTNQATLKPHEEILKLIKIN